MNINEQFVLIHIDSYHSKHESPLYKHNLPSTDERSGLARRVQWADVQEEVQNSWPNGGFHDLGYPHSWMVYVMEIPLKWMMARGIPIVGNPQMRCNLLQGVAD